MARKFQKTTHKPSKARPAKTTGGRPPAKKSPAGKSAPPRSGGRAASRPAAPRPLFRSVRALLRRGGSPSPRSSKPARTISTGLSLDRKLDILGIALSLLGLLTLLALPSSTHGSLTGSWMAFIARAFGWGMYLFSLSLLVIGLWLVLRNFERVPQFSVERLAGLLLLYANILAILHFFLLPATRQEGLDLAAAGKGGGYAGALLLDLLRANLGWGGAAVAVAAWLLIALGLTLDVSVIDLFRWAPPLVVRVQDWLDDLRNHKGESPVPFTPNQAAARPAPGPVQAGHASPEPSPAPAAAAFVPVAGHPLAYILPRIDEMLDKGGDVTYDDETDRRRAHVIEETLASFGAPVNVVEINRGPTITQFGVEPDFIENRSGRMRVRVGKIAALADDLALALSARRIRVEAPVPGKGFVGIEVPNEQIASVALRDVIESEAFRRLKTSLRFALGQDVAGNAVAADLSGMPHLLIAGATGSGKSVCVNAFICCLLINNTPDDLRLVMVDPKRVELTGYNGIPHLLAPVVVEMERVVGALQWVLREMDQRYHKLAQAGCRNIIDYNNKMIARGEKKLPYLVVIIDELADLMMLAPEETERTLTRLAQLARATGIHLVIATQRPSVDVVTGLIKANFPARIAFAVASGIDSRVILDQPGAERLLGRGDMLFQAPDAPAPIRMQGCFVSENEIQRLVQYWLGFSTTAPTVPTAVGGVVDALPPGIPLKQIPLWEEMESENADPMLNESIDLVRRQGRASISMLQRRLRIGYTRAARIIETMQEKGIIGKEPGPQGFEVLDYGNAAQPREEQGYD
jgi:S-DNA-T family DNA segregation ATPase FtsK/SpoIIIE